MTFKDEEDPTRPEGWRVELRVAAERLLACPPNDLAVLRALREEARQAGPGSDKWQRYESACVRFTEMVLGPF